MDWPAVSGLGGGGRQRGRLACVLSSALASAALSAASAEPGPLPLWPGVAPGAPPPAQDVESERDGGVFDVYQPTYQVYRPGPGAPPGRVGMVVFPGGGYGMLATGWEGGPVAQWLAAKRAASEAIVAAGATITHHHAIGTDHRPWLGAEIGEAGVRVLRAVKAELDPTGILNPGVLLPSRSGAWWASSPARAQLALPVAGSSGTPSKGANIRARMSNSSALRT